MMGGLQGPLSMCPKSKLCWEWARIYMSSCLCDVKDKISFVLGILSIISWSISEVPQIITNYKMKSTEGMSVAFLLTWLVGDLLNLFGCLLEPATLYTVIASLLALQTIYYGHIYHRLKIRKFGFGSKGQFKGEEHIEKQKHSWRADSHANDSVVRDDEYSPVSSPIPVATSIATGYGSVSRDRYYISARSLATSPNPVVGSDSYHWACRKKSHASILHQSPKGDPFLGSAATARSAPPSDTKSLLCAVSVTIFFLGSFGLNVSAARRSHTSLSSDAAVIIPIGRKLLQVAGLSSSGNNNTTSALGTYLGWLMAIIYMGGRLPQIYLNGLNPLMFFLAVVGNATYAASILVSSIEWSKIEPNLPWLFDAVACMVLDSVILVQFIYYARWATKDGDDSSKQHLLEA
ncbi:Lysosomal amino acid transporter 1 [Nymphaea thermarum]|nr:Lysosomal amino acid transporter 1 [Nymphaea thermarum]